ncbi:MAG: hypothetical protein J0L67_14870 [Cytophagales bacterium]|nr:hypothetical protein [Cytophagales bacterium]
MYREILKPAKKSMSLQLPKELVGKTVEVLAFEVVDLKTISQRKVDKKQFWKTFGSGKKSTMTIEKIRKSAWRKVQW